MCMADLLRFCSIVGCDSIASDKHHIGGYSSPMIWVCKSCHGKIHGVLWRSDHAHLTKEGLKKARAEGRIGGNPGIKAGDPEAIRKIALTRRVNSDVKMIEEFQKWIPVIQRLRSGGSDWMEVAHTLGITAERARRSTKRLIAIGLLDPVLMARVKTRPDPARGRLVQLVVALSEGRTLQQVASKLESMGELTPRGGRRWHPSSIANLLRRRKT